MLDVALLLGLLEVLNIQLQFLNVFYVTVDLHLQCFIFSFEIVSLVNHICQVLFQLGTLPLMIQKDLCLFRLNFGAFRL